MQKTFLFASVIIVSSITLLSVRLQLNQASADTLADVSATPAAATTTVALDQTTPQAAIASTAPSSATAPATTPAKASPAPAASAPKKAAAATISSSGAKTLGTSEQYPEKLIIPALNITVPIVAVGVNSKGEMAVPPGNTDEVGWYKGGPMPGSVGSAVLDAHVFAAFKTLRNLPVGADIYVLTKGGSKLHFVIKDSRVYTLSELTSTMLFGNKGERDLNLITCAGTYVPSIGTYDHRLVDYAEFVDEE